MMAGGTVFSRRYSAILRPHGPLYLRRLQSVSELAGCLEEVRRRRHTHRDPQAGCWCEFGDDGWKVVDRYDQITLEGVCAEGEHRQWGAGIDAMLDSISAMYEAKDAAETE